MLRVCGHWSQLLGTSQLYVLRDRNLIRYFFALQYTQLLFIEHGGFGGTAVLHKDCGCWCTLLMRLSCLLLLPSRVDDVPFDHAMLVLALVSFLTFPAASVTAIT
jgi:hypothetical protein